MSTPLIAVALPQELNHEPLPFDFPIVFTGVGKLNAALALNDAIGQHQPSLVINFGTVGSIANRASGLVEIAEVVQRDMDAVPLVERGITPFDDGPVRFQSGFPGARCGTGDSFVNEVDPWLIEQNVDVVDMELFALAMVCHRHDLPWRSFKYVTDDADGDAGDDWLERVHKGRQLFIEKLQQVAEMLAELNSD